MARNISWTCKRCGVSKDGYRLQLTAKWDLEAHQASRKCKANKRK
jgi:hypothetical protein